MILFYCRRSRCAIKTYFTVRIIYLALYETMQPAVISSHWNHVIIVILQMVWAVPLQAFAVSNRQIPDWSCAIIPYTRCTVANSDVINTRRCRCRSGFYFFFFLINYTRNFIILKCSYILNGLKNLKSLITINNFNIDKLKWSNEIRNPDCWHHS